jgi:hypothetical protein
MSEEQNSAPVFRVGQKVVCVDASGILNGFYVTCGDLTRVETNSQIYAGDVYTLAWIGSCPETKQPIVHLAERNRPFGLGYCVNRFRPVVERKTDISIFTAMLNPSRKKVTA